MIATSPGLLRGFLSSVQPDNCRARSSIVGTAARLLGVGVALTASSIVGAQVPAMCQPSGGYACTGFDIGPWRYTIENAPGSAGYSFCPGMGPDLKDGWWSSESKSVEDYRNCGLLNTAKCDIQVASHGAWDSLEPGYTYGILFQNGAYSPVTQIGWKTTTPSCINTWTHTVRQGRQRAVQCPKEFHPWWVSGTGADALYVCARNIGNRDPGKNLGPCPPETCAQGAGNPINVGNGNKYQIETDYIGPGAFPLAFVRTYNSLDEPRFDNQFLESRPVGAHWRHSYHRFVRLNVHTIYTTARLYIGPTERDCPSATLGACGPARQT